MKQDEELWMKKMKEVLRDYSEPVSPNGWEKLEKELSPVDGKRIYLFTYRRLMVVAAVLLLAISGVSLFFMRTQTAEEIRHMSLPALALLPDVMPESCTPEKQIVQIKPVKSYANVLRQGEPDESAFVSKGNEEKQTEKIDNGTPAGEEYTGNNGNRVIRPSGKDKLHIPVDRKKKTSRGKWSAALSFSNAGGGTTTENRDYLVMAASPDVNDDFSTGMIPVSDKGREVVFEGGIPYIKESVTVSELDHKQPISFGISVRKGLSNGFSVETGLVYTLLASDGHLIADPSKKIEQKLHYIGIPIRGNWNFIDSRRFTLYLSAGGMMEKCVYGKIDSKKNTVKPLQFSVGGGVGAQFNASKHIGMYVEPGASYYFSNGSDVQTIRKETPFNFNLQLGIRFTH